MNFPFFIAKRYVLSKKSTNAINIISGISVVGVAVATTALVVVLSVFNGFHDMVASLLTNFDPQLKIVAAEGKTMIADSEELSKVKHLDEIEVATECVEDMALAVCNGKQVMVTLKGVEDSFEQLTHIDECTFGQGEFALHAGVVDFAVAGAGAAQLLGCNVSWRDYMRIYAPLREGQLDMGNPETGFVLDSLFLPPNVFSVGQAKYDRGYVLTTISFARRIFGMKGEITSLELRVKPECSVDAVKKKVRKILGEKYLVYDRFEQQADTFRIMQIEKVLAYFFLTFILIVACFNIIGSISMLIIDKRYDVETLRNLGADDKQIERIFLFEGRIISLIGAVVGIAVGLLLCWLQQEYGMVKMGSANLVTNAYPVSVHYSDILVVLFTVIAVGWAAVWYPVHYMSRRLLSR